MKKVIVSLPVIILMIFSACRNLPSKTSGRQSVVPGDTIRYTVRTITKRDKDCDSTQKKDCEIVNIKYHVFEQQPVLNDSIKNLLLQAFNSEGEADTSLEQQAEHFMSEYEKFKEEPYALGRQYELLSSTKLLTRSGDLLTLQADTYTYTGGAHGISFTRYINYDIRNRMAVTLDDVLLPGSRDSLTHIAEAIFKKNEGLDPGLPLRPDAYFFKDNKFSLNDNYTFTPEGILFLYNQYEIKPYAAGKTRLLVPYTEIKGLLKPHNAAEQFLK